MHCSLNNNRGFTLMELLVVIVIISISFSLFLTINFSFSNPGDAIKKEALKLQRILEFAHEQSVIRAEEYGVRFNEQRYRFMQLDDETEKWVDITTDKLLRDRQLPDNIQIELLIEDIEVSLDEKDIDTGEPGREIKPQVFIMSSGELSPNFVARFRISGFDDFYELHGDLNGKYALKEIKDE